MDDGPERQREARLEEVRSGRRASRLGALAPGALLVASCRLVLGIDEDVPLLDSPLLDGAASSSGADASPRDGQAEDRRAADVVDAHEIDSPPGPPDVAADRRFALYPLSFALPPLSNWVNNGTGTVLDLTTGLEWELGSGPVATSGYVAARDRCDGLKVADKNDWRLPTRIELLTVLDFALSPSSLDTNVFWPGLNGQDLKPFWTASVGSSTQRFTLNPLGPSLALVADANTALASMCVRGGPTTSPAVRYAVNGGIARDVRTGLEWQLAPKASAENILAATVTCTNSDLSGGGWRLPDVRELVSLVDETQPLGNLHAPGFAAGPSTTFWSSTAVPTTLDYYVVSFADAGIQKADRLTAQSVRCVRK